ncbi:MAG: hypothetical protein K2X01_06945 [Cyanobacteria bacterium]|nr:hypothetical protein [Cyanobacteriota bacterium]
MKTASQHTVTNHSYPRFAAIYRISSTDRAAVKAKLEELDRTSPDFAFIGTLIERPSAVPPVQGFALSGQDAIDALKQNLTFGVLPASVTTKPTFDAALKAWLDADPLNITKFNLGIPVTVMRHAKAKKPMIDITV